MCDSLIGVDTGLVEGLQNLFEDEKAVTSGVSVLPTKFTLLCNPVFNRVSLVLEKLGLVFDD